MAGKRSRRGQRIMGARKAAQMRTPSAAPYRRDEERIRRFEEGQLRGQRI
jgi:hypothetical protein